MTAMDDVIWLRDLHDDRASEAGPKIARLGHLRRLGLHVPDGFAVTAGAFSRFLTETGLSTRIEVLCASMASGRAELAQTTASIQAMIEETAVPPATADTISVAYEQLCNDAYEMHLPVAVRSSATKEDSTASSFAGQYATHLGICGHGRVVAAVRSCWASLFSEHALHYRLERGLSHTDSPMAVGVLSLVNARSAGVAFSVHPVTGNRSRMVIEASWGWGEAVVQGLVMPDHVELDAADGRILDYVIADKQVISAFDRTRGAVVELAMPAHMRAAQVLTEEELAALFAAVKSIEAHYKVPVDVEWVVDQDRRPGEPLTIVQTRPVTAAINTAQTRWDPLAYAMKYGMERR
jgi:pyruvate, water dikinase